MRMALRMLMSYCCITLLRSGSEGPFDQARAISKILFNLGSFNFLAYLECVRSYAWSKGHSDPDLSSVVYVYDIHSRLKCLGGVIFGCKPS